MNRACILGDPGPAEGARPPCRGCGDPVPEHRVRSDTGKPKRICRKCERAYLKAWRAGRGWAKAKLWNTWKGILARCLNRDQDRWVNCSRPIPRFSDYGARGIKVCKRWQGPQGFRNFVADVGPPPSPTHQIDRRRNEGNYAPSNVRWATPAEQHGNRRQTHWLTAKDPATGAALTLMLAEWARKTGINRHTLRERLKRGWTPDRAVATPVARLEPVPF